MKVKIGWVLRETPCFDEYLGPEISVGFVSLVYRIKTISLLIAYDLLIDKMPEYLKWYYSCPAILLGDFGYDKVHYLKTSEIEVSCNHIIDLTVCSLQTFINYKL
jgi:hypothetical protein